MDKKNTQELAAKVMELVLSNGRGERLIKSDAAGSIDITQEVVEALAVVSSKVAVSHLIKVLEVCDNPMQVADLAQQLVMAQAHTFDDYVTLGLAEAVEALQELVDPTPTNGTTH